MKHKRIHYYRIFLAAILVIAIGAGIWYCWHSYRLHTVPEDGVLVEEGTENDCRAGKTGWA